VQVDVAESGEIKHPPWNDAPVADHDDGIEFEIRELSAEVPVVLDALRLRDRQSVLQRALLDGRGDEFQAASFGTIRLRHYQGHAESSLDQPVECWHGEARRAAKDEIQGWRHRASE